MGEPWILNPMASALVRTAEEKHTRKRKQRFLLE